MRNLLLGLILVLGSCAEAKKTDGSGGSGGHGGFSGIGGNGGSGGVGNGSGGTGGTTGCPDPCTPQNMGVCDPQGFYCDGACWIPNGCPGTGGTGGAGGIG